MSLRSPLALAALALAPALALGQAATYDLRGPAPKVGQVMVTKSKMTIKDADLTMKAGGTELEMKQTMTMTQEEEDKFLAVDGRNVTRVQTKVLKDQTKVTVTFGEQNTTEDTDGELAGEVIISEKKGDDWKHALVDRKPTEKQEKELKRRTGPESDDDLYPAEKVAVGHAWETDAAKLKKHFGKDFKDIKGTVKQKFVRVEKLNGEDCAVIEMTGPITGTMIDDEDGELAFEMKLKVTSYRSLKTAVDVKSTLSGTVRMSGKQKIDGMEAEIVLKGTMIGEDVVTVK